MAGEIKYEELKCLIDKNEIILIDVRNAVELETNGRIPKSLNIPLGEFAAALEMDKIEFTDKYCCKEKPTTDQNIAISCASGRRAAKAYEIVVDAGYCKTRLYSGSFNDWIAQGGEVSK